jgi:hypothetical protein
VDAVAKTLPTAPRAGAEGLSKPLREVIGAKLAAGTPLWLAGHETSHRIAASLLPFPRALTDIGNDFKRVRSFALALRIDKNEAAVQGDLRCRDEKSAQALQEYFQKQTLPGIGTPKVVSTLPEPKELASLGALSAGVGHEPLHGVTTLSAAILQEHWVTFQLRSNSEAVFGTLQRRGGPMSLVP